MDEFFGGYLHEDWPEDYNGDPCAALGAFVVESRESARMLAPEIDEALDTEASEEGLRLLLFLEIQSAYDPRVAGISVREWLRRIADQVQQLLSEQGG
jgi:hypothetical protein